MQIEPEQPPTVRRLCVVWVGLVAMIVYVALPGITAAHVQIAHGGQAACAADSGSCDGHDTGDDRPSDASCETCQLLATLGKDVEMPGGLVTVTVPFDHPRGVVADTNVSCAVPTLVRSATPRGPPAA
ncbi:MAG: DUF2946 family protein [Planctomycetota bacterium]